MHITRRKLLGLALTGAVLWISPDRGVAEDGGDGRQLAHVTLDVQGMT
jgi:hypothetical protein